MDFAPSHVLYRKYLSYVQGFRRTPDDPDLLTTRQFGVALVRVFGLEGRRVQRRIAGKKLWGYIGMKGPGSVVVQDYAGSPKLHKHDAD